MSPPVFIAYVYASELLSFRIGTPEATRLVANAAAIYSPELIVGYTAVGLFKTSSNQLSFTGMLSPGFQYSYSRSMTWGILRLKSLSVLDEVSMLTWFLDTHIIMPPVADPMYHNSGIICNI